MSPTPFITLDNVTVRLRDKWLLHHTSWQIRRGENWVIWGANGAGKTTLAKALLGRVAIVQGSVQRHYEQPLADTAGRPAMAYVSPEQYHQLFEHQRLLDEMRHFSGRVDEVTRGRALLGRRPFQASAHWARIERLLDLKPLLIKEVETLSSGEMRKLLLGRALAADPQMLILDEPFNALDGGSQERLMNFLIDLEAAGTQMILITHRPAEILPCFSHVLHLQSGRVVWQGKRSQFLKRLSKEPCGTKQVSVPAPAISNAAARGGAPLIEMRGVRVKYGSQLVLDCIDWVMRAGENWALIGPNGAGKSTLLRLITGDNLQSYANRIALFGRLKGSGESVWEIKQHIGVVHDELQARYQKDLSGFDVVCSGYFDSLGLYRLCSGEQRRTARRWVSALGLEDLARQRMARLSFGQQRLILIARAMVKSPPLLILDEPCNGLDEFHCRQVLDLLDQIGRNGCTNLLYVSHRPAEIPACITHRLFLEDGRISRIQC